jgi:hypothetical protein
MPPSEHSLTMLPGGNFSSKPSAVSWGPDRLDIIGITVNGTMTHKYWDGSNWQPDVDQ